LEPHTKAKEKEKEKRKKEKVIIERTKRRDVCFKIIVFLKSIISHKHMKMTKNTSTVVNYR